MADRERRPPARSHAHSLSRIQLTDLVLESVRRWSAAAGVALEATTVVDLGGGTGGMATALAAAGLRVTVIDPSPDALASLERRTAEAGFTGRITGRQGDAGDLVGLIGPAAADLVICHRVLEVVDSPSEAMAAIAAVLRPGGALSLATAQRRSQVLSQALAGHFAAARQTFADASRLDYDQIIALVAAAGLRVDTSQGIGALADHVPEALAEADLAGWSELSALDREVAHDPAFRALAPLLHVFAQRPG